MCKWGCTSVKSVEKGAGMQRNCIKTNSSCESVKWFSGVVYLRQTNSLVLCLWVPSVRES